MSELPEFDRIDPGETTARTALLLFRRLHDEHLKLCDVLEDIADSFPNHFRSDVCALAASLLESRVPAHHKLEEQALFPLLVNRARTDSALRRSLLRLTDEHRLDEGYFAEAIDLLKELAGGQRSSNAEADGYLLRGLFESWRRHIAFEDEHVLPKAQALLSDQDLVRLRDDLKRIWEETGRSRPPAH